MKLKGYYEGDVDDNKVWKAAVGIRDKDAGREIRSLLTELTLREASIIRRIKDAKRKIGSQKRDKFDAPLALKKPAPRKIVFVNHSTHRDTFSD